VLLSLGFSLPPTLVFPRCVVERSLQQYCRAVWFDSGAAFCLLPRKKIFARVITIFDRLLMSKKAISPPDRQRLTLLLPAALCQRLDELRDELGHESTAQVAQDALRWYLRVYRAPVTRAVAALTPRQREVLRLIGEGQATKQIASELGISLKTVEWHRTRLKKILQAHSLADLIRFAICAGL
jgi:DNA-binding CsgD family transcriptional regulator